jgi:hypothetical protein
MLSTDPLAAPDTTSVSDIFVKLGMNLSELYFIDHST